MQNLSAYTKAIVSAIMAAILLINTFFNTGIVVDEATVTTIVALVLPYLVFRLPNKGA